MRTRISCLYLSFVLSVCGLMFCNGNKFDVSTRSADAYVHYENGIENYYNNYIEQAAQDFESALKCDSSFAMAHCRLSMVYLKMGDELAAQKTFLRAKRLFSDVSNREKLFMAMWENRVYHKYQRYSLILMRYIEKYPRDTEGYLLLAEDCLNRNLYNQSIAYLNELLTIDMNNLPGHKLLAQVYTKLEKYDLANEHILKCLVINSQDVDAVVTSGDIYRAKGDYEKAKENYNQAIELKPSFSRAHLHLATFYKETGQHLKALDQYRLAFELLPSTITNESTEHAILAEVYLLMGNLEKATESANRALQLNNENTKAHHILGKIFLQKDKLSEARRSAAYLKNIIENKNLSLYFRDVDYYDLLGRIAMKEDDWHRAIEQFYLAWQHSSTENKMMYQCLIASSYFKLGHYQQTKHFCEQVIDKNPDNITAHYLLAQVHENLNDYSKAMNEYQTFISLAEGTHQYQTELKNAKRKVSKSNQRYLATKR